MSSVEGSHAPTSAAPGTASGSVERNQDCGRSTPVSLARFDHATSSWRTSQTCLVEGLASFSETWPRSGMTRSGTAYLLPTLAPRISEIGSGSSRIPTPTVTDSRGGRNLTSGRSNPNSKHHSGTTLCDYIVLWPTPRSSGASLTGGSNSRRAAVKRGGYISGRLNPTWVEWLMGFPLEHTALDAWETRSSRKSRIASGGR